MVKIFAFDEDILDALVASLSPERIATYMAAAGGDREKAMRLYTWNTAVSAAFYGPLQGLEVALRNAMHRSLAARYGPDWYDNPACQFDAGTLHRIGNAKDKLRGTATWSIRRMWWRPCPSDSGSRSSAAAASRPCSARQSEITR